MCPGTSTVAKGSRSQDCLNSNCCFATCYSYFTPIISRHFLESVLLLLLLSHFSCVRLYANHRQQPTRLPQPWDSLGKNTGSGLLFPSPMHERKGKVKSLSRVWLLATPWTAAYQAPASMGFSKRSTGVSCHCLLRRAYWVSFNFTSVLLFKMCGRRNSGNSSPRKC